MKTFIIREATIDPENEIGIFAMSLVDSPANEQEIQYFSNDDVTEFEGGSEFFEYSGPDDDVTRDFCQKHVGKQYHRSEIQTQLAMEVLTEPSCINANNSFFSSFNGMNGFNIDNQLYNCRHWFRRVPLGRVDPEVLRRNMYNFSEETPEKDSKMVVKFSVDNEEKQIIRGMVLQSNQMIYRNNADLLGNPGYVYFSRSTIKDLKEKFAFNMTMTLQHEQDITGLCTLLTSEIIDTVDTTMWYLSYHVEDPKLWQMIKERKVVGFSLEGILKFN